jgi:hypothetical protein
MPLVVDGSHKSTAEDIKTLNAFRSSTSSKTNVLLFPTCSMLCPLLIINPSTPVDVFLLDNTRPVRNHIVLPDGVPVVYHRPISCDKNISAALTHWLQCRGGDLVPEFGAPVVALNSKEQWEAVRADMIQVRL